MASPPVTEILIAADDAAFARCCHCFRLLPLIFSSMISPVNIASCQLKLMHITPLRFRHAAHMLTPLPATMIADTLRYFRHDIDAAAD